MRRIVTAIEIEASAQDVWSVLTDLDGYPDWNVPVHRARGVVKAGQRIELKIAPPGLIGRTVRVRILTLTPNREFRWLGRFFFPGILDGDHRFEIEPLGRDRVRVVRREDFSGVLVPLFASQLIPRMRSAFEASNLALKARVEAMRRNSGDARRCSPASPTDRREQG